MRGILTERDRMNLPMGMSELDLITYSPTMYEMYRNEGSGYDKDAFRYDPIVSAGMLASDFAVADGLAWVNLLTPESLGAINPGDNLVVPVQTFDNYKELPPWEKRLSHEVSYDGGMTKKCGAKNESGYSANLLNLQASQVGMANNFVGDFSYYFDNESRLLGRVAAAIESPRPEVPIEVTPTTIVPPRTILLSPKATAIASAIDIPPRTIVPPRTIPLGPKATAVITATQVSDTPGLVATTTPPASTPASSTPASEVINGGYLPSSGGGVSMGGGGMSMGGGAEMPEEAPVETSETSETSGGGGDDKKITKECKINYIPVIIGFVVLAIIGYAIAKQKKKDVKMFSIAGAIIGGLLGYAYAKHQCNPIEALTKVGIKSKSI